MTGGTSGSAGTRRAGTEQAGIPPDLLGKWQTIVDTMAELVEVPAGLVMRVDGDEITVCASSRTAGNPYHVGESERWEDSGLYCETAIKTGRSLLVPDALADIVWRENPDVPRGMISYLGFPIHWPGGRPFGTICVLDSKPNGYDPRHERLIERFRDIIEHHLGLIIRDRDRQLTAEDDRTRNRHELDEARRELAHVSRISEVGHLAAGILHEVNQPLAASITFGAACRRWLDRDEPDLGAAREVLQQSMDAARRAASIVDGLRSLAQNRPAPPAAFDLHDLIGETMAVLRDDLVRGRIVEKRRFEAAARHAMGVRIQVQLVLHNLIRNAVEAMAEVDGRGRQLVVSADRVEPGRLRVTVDDNGAGLAPATAERILRAPYSTKPTGMGIGLTICRSIVEAGGGTITASPHPDGTGTRVSFTLPADPRDRSESLPR